MKYSTERRALRALLLILALLLSPLAVGCDCSEDDVTGGFGPRCDDDGTAADSSSGSGTGTLLVSDLTNSSIRRFTGISALEGTTETDPSLTGALTRLSSPMYLTLHPTTGELIVADQGTSAILFFSSPSEVNGNVPPGRVLTGAATTLSGPVQTFVDSTTDELYVLDRANSQILVFTNSSTIDGEVAPDRIIGGATTAIASPNAFIFNASAEQVSVLNPAEILTFETFRSANGAPAPSGRVSGAATNFSNLTYGELTSAGTLILVDAGSDQILTFESWVFDRTNEAPTRFITGNNTRLSEPRQFVLSGDSIYIADTGNILFFDSLSTTEGNNFPTRFFSGIGPSTQSLQGLVFP